VKPSPHPELEPYYKAAMQFVQAYCVGHEYFGAEEVCDAYKAAGLPVPPDKGWRDRWGAVMSLAARKGWVKKAGKVVPKSGATHMASTALWMSNLFKGERTLVIADVDFLNQLKAAWMTRDITDIRVLIQRAYEFGFDQGAAGRAKIKGG
jgi:hypothetical protein